MKPSRTWHIEKRYIDELKEHPRNPRYVTQGDMNHLKKSIMKFGLIDKPIITYEGLVVGGHQRIKALQEMGEKFCDCWVIDDDDLTDDEIDELNIRLNKNTGEWDWDKLANEWDVNMLCQWGFKAEDFDEGLQKQKPKKISFEFEDDEEFEEFVGVIKEFPCRKTGSWSYKMKIRK